MKTSATMVAAASASGFDPMNYKFMQHISEQGKSYITMEEFAARKEIFAATDARIQEHNASESSYRLGHNKFSDLTEYERKMRKGFKQNPNSEDLVDSCGLFYTEDVPESWDWREHNAVTAVKDQGSCGSCWTFSATGALEGAHAIKSGKLLAFSEQQIVDCQKEDKGCDGGDEVDGFKYAKTHYLMTEKEYPYKGKDQKCKYDKDKATDVETKSVHTVHNAKHPDVLKAALAQQGPLSVAIQADIDNYESGIFDDPKCGCDLDHSVLMVGYGSEKGRDYWIVKNSWAADWGEKGYIRFAAEEGKGVCCVQDYVHYPLTTK